MVYEGKDWELYHFHSKAEYTSLCARITWNDGFFGGPEAHQWSCWSLFPGHDLDLSANE